MAPRNQPLLIPVGDDAWTIEHVPDLPELAKAYRRVRPEEEWYGLTIRPERRILIAQHDDELLVAESVVHELLHAGAWRLSEPTVTALARRITPALIRYGLRSRAT